MKWYAALLHIQEKKIQSVLIQKNKFQLFPESKNTWQIPTRGFVMNKKKEMGIPEAYDQKFKP